MNAPAIGSFIRPVGAYAYCFEVVAVIPADQGHAEQWHCRRYGMDDKHQPVTDGHQNINYLNGLKQVLPGVWRDEWTSDTPRWTCCPLYYRRLDLKGQQDFFI